jgi:hypothetical protein
MAPMVEVRARVYVMTEELVLKQTNQVDLKTITYLNLHDNRWRRLSHQYYKKLASLEVCVYISQGMCVCIFHKDCRSPLDTV